MTSMAEPVRLVVHGHFYQPPRENPWTEEVPVEPSAAPFHDWNERITAECYRPNGWARVVDDHGRVRDVVNNYRHLSFNVGPTLLSWLDAHHPEVGARMVEGDADRHGAIAQAYNHLILPLANERDVRTQIRWGLADFAARFGRPARACGCRRRRSTTTCSPSSSRRGCGRCILAPGQAEAVRPLGGSDDDVARRRRRLRPRPACPTAGSTPTGAAIDLVFYDGALSHDLAFALSGLTSQALIARVRATAADGTPVVVATDGETFGHHHRYADRALAYAFAHEAPANGVHVLTLAAAARRGARHPRGAGARERVVVRPRRRPVEGGLRVLHRRRAGLEPGVAGAAARRPRPPARPRQRGVRAAGRGGLRRPVGGPRRLRRGARRRRRARGASSPSTARPGADVVEALTLLEAQRQALLMYTSCGWFFNDLAGIETVQVLRYAARLVDLLDELGEPAPLERFLEVLGTGPVEPARGGQRRRHLEPPRAAEPGRRRAGSPPTWPCSTCSSSGRAPASSAGHEVGDHQRRQRRRGALVGVAGRVELVHRRTRRRVGARLRRRAPRRPRGGRRRPPRRRRPRRPTASPTCSTPSSGATASPAVLRAIDEGFGPRDFGLDAALPDTAGDIVASAADELADRFAAALEGLWVDNRDVLGSLATAGHPLEPELRAPVEFALGRRLRIGPGRRRWAPTATTPRWRPPPSGTPPTWRGRPTASASTLAERPGAARPRRGGRGAHPPGGGRRTPTTRPPPLLRDLLRLRRPLGTGIDLDRAQDLVVDALAADPAVGPAARHRRRPGRRRRSRCEPPVAGSVPGAVSAEPQRPPRSATATPTAGAGCAASAATARSAPSACTRRRSGSTAPSAPGPASRRSTRGPTSRRSTARSSPRC